MQTPAIVAAVVLCLCLAACGGGGSSGGSGVVLPLDPPSPPSVPPIVPQPEPLQRTDIWMGYFAGGGQVAAHADHVNQAWIGMWGTGLYWQDVSEQGKAALANGVTSLVVWFPFGFYGEVATRQGLDQLRELGLLQYVTALYPRDEPEIQGHTDAEVREANATVRRVLADYPEAAGVKLAVIYSKLQVWPGFDTFDWVGFDQYEAGAAALSNEVWQDMVSRLKPEQRIILVPGGISPWRQDPEPFFAAAQADPRVVAIVPFAWTGQEHGLGEGISTNGMRSAYCAMGRKIKSPNLPVEPC